MYSRVIHVLDEWHVSVLILKFPGCLEMVWENQSLLDSAYLFVVGVKIEVVIVMRVHPYRYRADAEWCNPGTR